MTGDIFEDLKDRVCCEFISDMNYSPYRENAKRIMRMIDIQPYPLNDLSDLAAYLYSYEEKFEDYEQAFAFFRNAKIK